MTISMPETTKTFGAQRLVVLTTKPANLAAVTNVAALAGKNITCHMVGDWWPTASTDKVTRARKMCQVKTTQALGVSTWETPALQYTYNPQKVGTAGYAGNEAYEALPEGATVYLLQEIGLTGTTATTVGDAYRLFPVELGPQVPGSSSDDAGGEAVINQEIAFLNGYSGPVSGVLA